MSHGLSKLTAPVAGAALRWSRPLTVPGGRGAAGQARVSELGTTEAVWTAPPWGQSQMVEAVGPETGCSPTAVVCEGRVPLA